ncbi:MAG: dockerin type I domain-containing protein [Clostridium sp.]|nr:dockerin type I domain-containing protein [Clostridium sp.]
MKVKKIFAVYFSSLIMGMCVFNNFSMVSAENNESYALGDTAITAAEKQAFCSQFVDVDCAVDLNNITSVPTSWDLSTNSDSKYFPPIGNQGNIGSCNSWASTYYQFTYAANKLNNIKTTAQNAYSPTWTHNFLNGGDPDMGSNCTQAYDILKNQGALKMSEMPYSTSKYDTSWSTDTSAMMNALKTRLSYHGESTISSSGTAITGKTDTDLNEAKYLLSNGYVLLVRVQADVGLPNWSFKKRFNGDTSESVAYRAKSASGGHAMTVVGYDDNVYCDVNGNGKIEESEKGAFKVANSWGTGWGNDGYIWVLYDALNKVSANKTNNWEKSESGTRISIFARGDADINNIFHYIEVENYDVNMAGLLTINTGYRNKINIDLFRNSNSSLSYTTDNSISYLHLKQTNKNIDLDNPASFSGSIVFDYGEYDDPASICTNGYYYGVDINNLSSSNGSSFSNVSYKIIDNKFNVIKNISSIPTSIANGSNAKKSVKIQCEKGDIDYDGSITSSDATVLLNYLSNQILLSNLQYYLADFDNTGKVDISDLLALNNYILSNSSSSAELAEAYKLNQEIKQFLIENNYQKSEIEKIDKLSKQVQQQLKEVD